MSAQDDGGGPARSAPQLKLLGAVAVGYLLGRTKKMKFAITVGTALAGRRLDLDPRKLLTGMAGEILSSPEVADLRKQVTSQVVGAGKNMATSLVSAQAERLTNSLVSRTEALQKGTEAVSDTAETATKTAGTATKSAGTATKSATKTAGSARKTASTATKSATKSAGGSARGAGKAVSGARNRAPRKRPATGTKGARSA